MRRDSCLEVLPLDCSVTIDCCYFVIATIASGMLARSTLACSTLACSASVKDTTATIIEDISFIAAMLGCFANIIITRASTVIGALLGLGRFDLIHCLEGYSLSDHCDS